MKKSFYHFYTSSPSIFNFPPSLSQFPFFSYPLFSGYISKKFSVTNFRAHSASLPHAPLSPVTPLRETFIAHNPCHFCHTFHEWVDGLTPYFFNCPSTLNCLTKYRYQSHIFSFHTKYHHVVSTLSQKILSQNNLKNMRFPRVICHIMCIYMSHVEIIKLESTGSHKS